MQCCKFNLKDSKKNKIKKSQVVQGMQSKKKQTSTAYIVCSWGSFLLYYNMYCNLPSLHHNWDEKWPKWVNRSVTTWQNSLSSVISTNVRNPKLCIECVSDGFHIAQSIYLLLYIKAWNVEAWNWRGPLLLITSAGMRSKSKNVQILIKK